MLSRAKRVQKVIFGHEFFFDQIGQKMAKMWSKDFLWLKRVQKVVLGQEKIPDKLVKKWPKVVF